jgi:hypothetical protein
VEDEAKFQEELSIKIEDLFRNICETVSPTVDPTQVTFDPSTTDPYIEEPSDDPLTISPKKKLK